MAFVHEADYDGYVRQGNLTDGDYANRYPRMHSMAQVRVKPYRDEYMNLASDPYAGDRSSDDEDNRHIPDDSVRAYVNRLLFKAALKMNGEHVQTQGAAEDLHAKLHQERPRHAAATGGGDDAAHIRSSLDTEPGLLINRTPRRNQNKGLKKRRQRKSVEAKEAEKFPFPISSHQEGHPIFSASVYQLREYIESEVESKVRYIHQYYEDQFKTVNKERMSALAQLIKAKEMLNELQKRLEQAESYVQQYKSLCDGLTSQVQSGKAARRRRRLAKKHRKSGPLIIDRHQKGAGDKSDNPDVDDSDDKGDNQDEDNKHERLVDAT